MQTQFSSPFTPPSPVLLRSGGQSLILTLTVDPFAVNVLRSAFDDRRIREV